MASPGCLDPPNIATVERYRALLQVSESIASDRDLPDLFRSLAALLHRVVTFDFICLVLPDVARSVVRVHVLESSLPTRILPDLEIPMAENVRQLVWENQQPLVISNVDNDERFPIVSSMLRQDGVQSLCVLPLTTAQRRVGAMGFGSIEVSAYDAADLEFLQASRRPGGRGGGQCPELPERPNLPARTGARARPLAPASGSKQCASLHTGSAPTAFRHFLVSPASDESRLCQPRAL